MTNDKKRPAAYVVDDGVGYEFCLTKRDAEQSAKDSARNYGQQVTVTPLYRGKPTLIGGSKK